MEQGLSVVTPSYAKDFESCRLLCDSIDRYATGFVRHYVVVGSEDLARFSVLAGPRREVVDAATLLPGAFWRLPALVSWRGRRLSHGPGLGWPIYGWHLQQLRKIAMTLAQSSARVICIDSDNCLVRPVDLAAMAGGEQSPLYFEPGGVNATRPRHILWWRNAHRLLGLAEPSLPGPDFIGQMIVWDKASVVAMTERIERSTGRCWWQALGRVRDFAEYMIYGAAVTSDPVLSARHRPVNTSPCLVYWDGPALDAATLPEFLARLQPHHCAIAIQSFTATPVALIRSFALEYPDGEPMAATAG
jgi:hypothetical protein